MVDTTILEAVKRHAMAHYEESGWDYLVETYTDEEMSEALGKVKTVEAGIAKAARIARAHGSRRREHSFEF